jgi:uncharacterized phage protein (TIGR01671 family)
MREILFRGKTYDGEWVEGFLFNSQLCRIFWATAFNKEEDNMFYCEGKDVNPETVGQFTGLTDKNGKKIFEGDIVKCEAVYQENEDEYLSNYNIEVKYSKGYFYPFYLNGCWRSGIENIEVIGNIHDNPELIGEVE